MTPAAAIKRRRAARGRRFGGRGARPILGLEKADSLERIAELDRPADPKTKP